MEGRANRLDGGDLCDLDIEVSAAVGEGEQPRPALGAVSPRDPIRGLGVDDRDVRADPLCARATDPYVLAVGDQLGDGQLNPFLGLCIELGGCETDSDHGEALSVSTTQVDLLSYDATTLGRNTGAVLELAGTKNLISSEHLSGALSERLSTVGRQKAGNPEQASVVE
jgi:hypothetical protein